MIEQMDQVLSKELPTIMNQFPTEREDEAAARAASAGAAGTAMVCIYLSFIMFIYMCVRLCIYLYM